MRLPSFALLALLAGCSASHEGGDARRFVDDYERAICARGLRCEQELGAGWAHDAQLACHPSFRGWLAGADRAVALGRARLDADAARACLAELASLPCRVADPYPPSAASCERAIVPLARDGDACDPRAAFDACVEGSFCAATATDACGGTCAPAAAPGESCVARPCAPGSECSLAGAPTCVASPALGEPCVDRCVSVDGHDAICRDGTCVDAPVRAAGEPCGPTEGVCADDAYCSSGVCVARGAVGDACARSAECADGLRCALGACAELAAAGETCDANADCVASAPYCVTADDLLPALCTADPTGAPCTQIAYAPRFASRDTCPDGFVCSVRARCVPIAPLGEPCGPSAACDEGARCVDARCVAVARAGDPCGPDAACPTSAACRGGRCELLPDLEEPCADACVRGACDGGVCRLLADGAACTRTLECEGFCRDGACAPAAAEGADCGAGVGSCGTTLACVADASDHGTCHALACAP